MNPFSYSPDGWTLPLAIILLLFAGGCAETNTSSGAKNFEKIPPGEAEQIAHIAELTPELQDKRAVLPEQNGRVLRGVHPKAHGCVEATFTVNQGIAQQYQIGLFRQPGKSYQAMIRFSNASVRVAPDLEGGKHGSRGMAVKVYDVEGPMLDQDDGRNTQDFLMINTPQFAFADVRSYGFLTDALNASPHGNDPSALFGLVLLLAEVNRTPPPFPAPQPEDLEKLRAILAAQNKNLPPGFTLKDLSHLTDTLNIVVTKIQAEPVRNPLQVRYFGAASFLFGPDRVMKFSAAPRKPVKQEPFTTPPPADYLREALAATMQDSKDILFDFQVQVRDRQTDFGKDQALIENTSTTWDTADRKEIDAYISIATIRINAPQNTTSEAARARCEQLAYSPWHSLSAHQPVGGINRLRRSVYDMSIHHRKE